jgi:Family of unknown function (DUF5681)
MAWELSASPTCLPNGPASIPARRDTTGSHSLLSEAHDAPADSTQSNSAAPKAPEYSVGYGRPPIHSRYKPGRSGNPEGRPKGSCNVKTDLKKVYTDKIVIHESGKKRHVSRLNALLLRQWERAIRGDERAAQAAIANAKALGVFDETETDESSSVICLSKEVLEHLSIPALKELASIEKALYQKAFN